MSLCLEQANAFPKHQRYPRESEFSLEMTPSFSPSLIFSSPGAAVRGYLLLSFTGISPPTRQKEKKNEEVYRTDSLCLAYLFKEHIWGQHPRIREGPAMLPWGPWRAGCLVSGLIRSKVAVEVWKIPAHPVGSSQMAGAPPLSRWAVVWVSGSHTGLAWGALALLCTCPVLMGRLGFRLALMEHPGT